MNIDTSLKNILKLDTSLLGCLTDLLFLLFQYEILFCIEEEIDPAIMVVQSLLVKYPKVDAKLFIGKCEFYILYSNH